jgi:hypothetical protein
MPEKRRFTEVFSRLRFWESEGEALAPEPAEQTETDPERLARLEQRTREPQLQGRSDPTIERLVLTVEQLTRVVERFSGELASASLLRRPESAGLPELPPMGRAAPGIVIPRAQPPTEPRAVTTVTLAEMNTLFLDANQVYRLVAPTYGRYYYWVANFGPGALSLRTDADPFPGDPASETLPAMTADNQIPVWQGLRGLGVVTQAAGWISVRRWAW